MEKYILGVEIGGTKLQLAISSRNGKILNEHQGRVNVNAGAPGILEWLEDNIPAMYARASDLNGELVALGCGFGGPIDTAKGEVLKSVQIPGWSCFPLKAWFEEKYNLPTVIANDSNAATWGEYNNGSGIGSRYFFYTNMGSGVGGGIVIDGQLYDGQGYGAGEFGQTYVPDWTHNHPGKPEKIENLCSGWAIEERLRKTKYVPQESVLMELAGGDAQAIDIRNLVEAALAGDEFALQEIDRIAYSMGLGLANMLCLVNVEVIAIGGGVSNMGDLLIKPIRKYVRKYEFISSHNKYKIGKCELGDSIVLVGAILIARDTLNL
jgi:glucokinase